MILEYASRVLPKDGERCSGDAVFVRVERDSALFVLLDGLGHGDGAWRVAEHGLHILRQLPSGSDAARAIGALNTHLHGTRGAAATACALSDREVQIAGVGNVACRPLGFRCAFVPVPGVLGYRHQSFSTMRLTLPPGQGLVLHSDGISRRFEPEELLELGPEPACEHLLRHHRHRHDDASVLIITARSRIGGEP